MDKRIKEYQKKRSEVVKRLERDKKFQELKADAEQAAANAKQIRKDAAGRIDELRSRLAYITADDVHRARIDSFRKSQGLKPVLAEVELSIEAVENAAKETEPSAIENTIKKLEKFKDSSWKLDKDFRRAAIKYYNYIEPVLKELDADFTNMQLDIARFTNEYIENLKDARTENCLQEVFIKELFAVTNDANIRADRNISMFHQRLPYETPKAAQTEYPNIKHERADITARKLVSGYEQ